MKKFNLWGTLIVAAILGLVGFLLGHFLPLPTPFTSSDSRLFYTLLGMLTGILIYNQVSAWFVKTFTHLIRNLIARLAAEIMNQFAQHSFRGWNFTPERTGGRKKGTLVDKLAAAVILDTSSIIDGRVLDVAKAGFLAGTVLVPNFVLVELRQVADSADSLKRARGRQGFKIIDELKKVDGIKLEIWDEEVVGKAVDDKLIKLGKILHGRILTSDFNLNRHASVSGVRVLNLNELGNALKTLPIPGEHLTVKIAQLGKDKGQGVGYLFDGTMVVVKDASLLIEKEISIEVTKILQGPSGRMIFGKMVNG